MTKYYIDTCIWRDYFEDRKDRFRPLGDWALRLINKIVEEEEQIIISDILLRELSKDLSTEEVKLCLSIVPQELRVVVKTRDRQEKEARCLQKKRGIPLNDTLHTILARDAGAIMITRDRHFLDLTDLTEIRKPEELI